MKSHRADSINSYKPISLYEDHHSSKLFICSSMNKLFVPSNIQSFNYKHAAVLKIGSFICEYAVIESLKMRFKKQTDGIEVA